ncbi:MAG: glycine--tRNA ligase subunit beta, partial [Candidatus Bipolaricaulia bacterium]
SNKPTQAAKGFARSVGLSVDQLQLRDFEGKEYLTATITETGRPTLEMLNEVIPKIIAELKFPLSMRWNKTNQAFSRPIRWLVTLFGDALVDVTYADVPSDRVTYGLRSLNSPELSIAKAENYFEIMNANGIVVNVDERRAKVKQQVEALAAEVDGQVADDPDLLDEVTNLIEQPVAIRGSFDRTFLTLPPEVLITAMKKHQRYFPIFKDGELLPYFIAVANGEAENQDTIRTGNEEVLRARFADAKFFYEVDTRKPLSAFVPKLDGLTFQEQLGSYLDKVKRLKELVPRLAERLNLSAEERDLARRTAYLAKADLVTDMVVEFPDLQGVMGRYYAQKSDEDPQVAEAILEHYLPRFAGDMLPKSWPGIVVGLADRLDSLVGLFAVGLTPTGTADPYGLRRAALGIIQVLIDREISFSLPEAVQDTVPLLPVEIAVTTKLAEEVPSEVIDFIRRRLQGWLLDQGFRYDLVEAVLAGRGDNPANAYKTVKTLSTWVERPESIELLTAYVRSVRIVQEFKERFPLVPERLAEPASRQLYQAYQVARERISSEMDVDELMAAMLPLIDPINTFFDDILVMHEDQSLRNARLGLLQAIVELPKGVVDLTKVVF